MMVMAGVSVMAACSKVEGPSGGGGTGGGGNTATVKVSQLSFEGTNLSLDGENDITDMQACLFEDGVMTKVFTDIPKTDAGYKIGVEKTGGKLYMLANLSGRIDLEGLLSESTSEEEWLRTVVDAESENRPLNFFTGSVDLNSGYSYSVQMKRGVARFDLAVTSPSQEVKVKKIVIGNVAQKGYLFTPSAGVATPDTSSPASAEISFPEGVTSAQPGILYLYEQANGGIQVTATVEIAGQEKELTGTVSGNISRNTVYTINITKNDIDVYVNANIEDWEEGTDTEIEA